MKHSLTFTVLMVADYDEAIDFYVRKLGFELVEDTQRSPTKRWVRVRPRGSAAGLHFSQAKNDQERACIGNQTGGRVFFFLHTDDCERDYRNLVKHNIKIIRGPEVAPFGKVVVFADLYGNKWDLIEPIEEGV